MTAQEIIIWAYHLQNDISNFYYNNFNDSFRQRVGKIEYIETEMPDYSGPVYSILHFTDHNVYIKVEARYTSHYGIDFENCDPPFEVTPVTKTIQFYEKK